MVRSHAKTSPRAKKWAQEQTHRASDKPIALTLKIDSGTYSRLLAVRAKERRSHQDILKQALLEYLESVAH